MQPIIFYNNLISPCLTVIIYYEARRQMQSSRLAPHLSLAAPGISREPPKAVLGGSFHCFLEEHSMLGSAKRMCTARGWQTRRRAQAVSAFTPNFMNIQSVTVSEELYIPDALQEPGLSLWLSER